MESPNGSKADLGISSPKFSDDEAPCPVDALKLSIMDKIEQFNRLFESCCFKVLLTHLSYSVWKLPVHQSVI
jgi:hypothetical protein